MSDLCTPTMREDIIAYRTGCLDMFFSDSSSSVNLKQEVGKSMQSKKKSVKVQYLKDETHNRNQTYLRISIFVHNY